MKDSDVVTKRGISAELVQRMTEAAVARARAMGKAFTVAFVDEGGNLKALLRMDGAPLISVQIAQDKAYTAAGFGIPSHGWHEFIKDDPPLAAGATTGIDRLVIFGGGFPITDDGQVLGAIGVSGGHYTEDMEVAQAGLDAIG